MLSNLLRICWSCWSFLLFAICKIILCGFVEGMTSRFIRLEIFLFQGARFRDVWCRYGFLKRAFFWKILYVRVRTHESSPCYCDPGILSCYLFSNIYFSMHISWIDIIVIVASVFKSFKYIHFNDKLIIAMFVLKLNVSSFKLFDNHHYHHHQPFRRAIGLDRHADWGLEI